MARQLKGPGAKQIINGVVCRDKKVARDKLEINNIFKDHFKLHTPPI